LTDKWVFAKEHKARAALTLLVVSDYF